MLIFQVGHRQPYSLSNMHILNMVGALRNIQKAHSRAQCLRYCPQNLLCILLCLTIAALEGWRARNMSDLQCRLTVHLCTDGIIQQTMLIERAEGWHSSMLFRRYTFTQMSDQSLGTHEFPKMHSLQPYISPPKQNGLCSVVAQMKATIKGLNSCVSNSMSDFPKRQKEQKKCPHPESNEGSCH